MRISTNQLQQYGVNAMLDQQARLSKTQLQVASGKKFLSPAEDPAAAVAALEYTRTLGTLEQYQRNIDRAAYALNLEEQTLGSVQDHLMRLRELALQAGSGGPGPSGRLALSYEVRQLQQAVLDFANTRDADGHYVFGGFQNLTQPYTDAGSGVFTYSGDQGQRLIQVAPSTTIVVTDPGSEIFNAIPAAAGGITDVFAIIDSFAAGLEVNTFNANTIADLDSALERVVGTRASVGARINALEATEELNSSYTVDNQQNLSKVQDLDYAEAVSRLNLQLAGLEASQLSFARIQNLSLFNYLR
jgi:flagellar hook-associated protein 3 FlgL